MCCLVTPRRRLVGGEQFSRRLQILLNCRGEWVRTTKNAACGPFYFLECRHSLAKTVECGAGVSAECPRVNFPHPERDIGLSENASRQGS